MKDGTPYRMFTNDFSNPSQMKVYTDQTGNIYYKMGDCMFCGGMILAEIKSTIDAAVGGHKYSKIETTKACNNCASSLKRSIEKFWPND